MNLRVVAEAIWSVDPFRMGDPDTFTGEGDQVAYLRMAKAAVSALERWEASLGPWKASQ